jgi:hypothetical protein
MSWNERTNATIHVGFISVLIPRRSLLRACGLLEGRDVLHASLRPMTRPLKLLGANPNGEFASQVLKVLYLRPVNCRGRAQVRQKDPGRQVVRDCVSLSETRTVLCSGLGHHYSTCIP